MSRNRLEEIRQWKDEIDLTGSEISEHNFFTVHIEWLIEQAELVQELEKSVTQWMNNADNLSGEYIKLQKQNKHYREVVDSLLNPPKEISCDSGYVEYAMDILEELEESKNA